MTNIRASLLSNILVGTRLTYSMARDDMLSFSHVWRHVSERTKTPAFSAIGLGCLSTLLLLPALVHEQAFNYILGTILGAFLAGSLVGPVDRDASSHPQFRAKLDAIGYGFLIPIFFVASGVRLDLVGLLANPPALALVPLFLAALLLVRGIPRCSGPDRYAVR